MITLRDVCVFATGAALASMQMSACGDKARAPLAEDILPADTGVIPADRLPPTTEAFFRRTCWTKVAGYSQECGVVTVPERPGSDVMIELGVVRVFSKSESPQDDPLIYLEGGPGNAIIRDLDQVFPYFSQLADGRDLIFFDQRGTGVSRPSLDCGTALDVSACYELAAERTDPGAYTSAENARDVDAIRRALGYGKVNLLGISYGTRLALTVLRDFPEGVRAAVIDSVVPLQVDLLANLAHNAEWALQQLFATCAVDPPCHEKYPDPMEQLLTVAKRLDESPYESKGLVLKGADFVSILFNLLYSPVALTYIPFLIDQADQEQFELLEELSLNLSGGDFAFGMHLSLQCAEEVPFTTPTALKEAEAGVNTTIAQAVSGSDYFGYCADWPVDAADARENEPVSSAVPTLVMAGHFDPITPPAYAELAAESLSSSYVFVFDNESHGVTPSDCGVELVQDFLKAPTREPDAACLVGLPVPEFEAIRGVSGGAVLRPGRRAGRPPQFATQRPDEDAVAQVRRDLEIRLRL